MKNLFILTVMLLLLTSCSNYSYYWHGEEDDVYFTSKTPEKVDPDISIDDDDSNTYRHDYPQQPNTRRYPRYERRSSTRTSRPNLPQTRTSKPTSTSKPAPTRPSRPSRTGGGQSDPR